jgi:hypothetical protein
MPTSLWVSRADRGGVIARHSAASCPRPWMSSSIRGRNRTGQPPPGKAEAAWQVIDGGDAFVRALMLRRGRRTAAVECEAVLMNFRSSRPRQQWAAPWGRRLACRIVGQASRLPNTRPGAMSTTRIWRQRKTFPPTEVLVDAHRTRVFSRLQQFGFRRTAGKLGADRFDFRGFLRVSLRLRRMVMQSSLLRSQPTAFPTASSSSPIPCYDDGLLQCPG